MSITRREFTKNSLLYPSALAAASTLALSPQAAQAGIESVLVPDIRSFKWVTTGYCCWYCPNMLVVAHYMPILLMEVIHGGDSLITKNTVQALSVVSATDGEMLNNVRIWELTDSIAGVMFAGQGCKLCDINYAKYAMPKTPDSSGVCVGGGKASEIVTEFVDRLLPGCVPELLYTTESDINWRTSCRDLLNSKTYTSFVNCMTGSGPDCLGSKWGALYPRQMMTHETHPVRAAAISAYRALHTAANSEGNVDFNISLDIGLMSMIYPSVEYNGKVGSSDLDTRFKNPLLPSDIRYGFIWWVPVVCCKSINEIYSICMPEICFT